MARYRDLAQGRGPLWLLAYVWHPALFVFAMYTIVLSSIVLVTAR
jgi:hypothetical protein